MGQISFSANETEHFNNLNTLLRLLHFLKYSPWVDFVNTMIINNLDVGHTTNNTRCHYHGIAKFTHGGDFVGSVQGTRIEYFICFHKTCVLASKLDSSLTLIEFKIIFGESQRVETKLPRVKFNPCLRIIRSKPSPSEIAKSWLRKISENQVYVLAANTFG